MDPHSSEFQTAVQKAVEVVVEKVADKGASPTIMYGAFGVLTAAITAVGALLKRLTSRLDKSHNTHIDLLQKQVDALQAQLLASREDTADQTQARMEEWQQNMLRITQAVTIATDAVERADQSYGALVDRVDRLHLSVQEVVVTVTRVRHLKPVDE